MLRHCYHKELPCQWLLPRVSHLQLQLEQRYPAAVWGSHKGPGPLHRKPVTRSSELLIPCCTVPMTLAATTAVVAPTMVTIMNLMFYA